MAETLRLPLSMTDERESEFFLVAIAISKLGCVTHRLALLLLLVRSSLQPTRFSSVGKLRRR